MAEGQAKTIDQLPEKTEIQNEDLIVLDDGTQTYKILWSTILKAITGVTAIELEKESGKETGGIKITYRDGTSKSIKTTDPGKQDTLTFDDAPKTGSKNPVTSGGLAIALQNIENSISAEAQTARDAEKKNADDIKDLQKNLGEANTAINQNTMAIEQEAMTARQNEQILNQAIEQEAMTARENEQSLSTSIKNVSSGLQDLKGLFDKLSLYVDEDGYICQHIE